MTAPPSGAVGTVRDDAPAPPSGHLYRFLPEGCGRDGRPACDGAPSKGVTEPHASRRSFLTPERRRRRQEAGARSRQGRGVFGHRKRGGPGPKLPPLRPPMVGHAFMDALTRARDRRVRGKSADYSPTKKKGGAAIQTAPVRVDDPWASHVARNEHGRCGPSGAVGR